MINLSNIEVRNLAFETAKKIIMDNHWEENCFPRLYGIARGGIPAAYMISNFIPNSIVVDDPSLCDIIVDDLIDSGETKERYTKYNKPFYALIDKRVDEKYQDWITFPYERVDEETPVMDNLLRLEQFLETATNEEAKVIKNAMKDILKR